MSFKILKINKNFPLPRHGRSLSVAPETLKVGGVSLLKHRKETWGLERCAGCLVEAISHPRN